MQTNKKMKSKCFRRSKNKNLRLCYKIHSIHMRALDVKRNEQKYDSNMEEEHATNNL